MEFGMKGKTALVLGAGGGLGRAICESLEHEGVSIAAADIDAEAIAQTEVVLSAIGVARLGLLWDVSDLSSVDSQISAIESQIGPVDILVNNTGGPPPTAAAGQDGRLWTTYFQMMVLSVIAITDRVLPGTRERGWGRIITSTSSSVVAPIPNLGISNALRLWLVGWSKTPAREVGRDRVTANIILPGRIGTSRIKFLDESRAKREGRTVDDVVSESTVSIPLGRYGRPGEYGDVVASLASERAAYVTGSVIRVDGGLIVSI